MYRSRSSPYGDVYTIPTSAVDGIANRLYQEQKIREQQKLQQDKALDDEFAKNVAGVKSVDIPEITQAYSRFKQAHIASQRKGNKATHEDQMKVMLEKANVFSAINASKEDKEYLALRAKEGKNNKRYNPDYQIRINEKLNTQTSKRNRDLDDDDLLYKYAMPNIDKEIKAAVTPPMGKEVVEIDLGVDGSDPLKDKKKTYKVINPPNAVYNSLYHGIGSRADNDAFSQFMINSLNDDEKKKLRTDFEVKIASPEFKAVYGEVQPFPESASKTDLGEAVALKVMQSFVDLPLNGTEKSVANLDRVTKGRQKFAEEQQGRGFRHREYMAGLQDRYIRARARDGINAAEAQVGYLTEDLANRYGKDVTVTFGGKTEEKRAVFTDNMDANDLRFIQGKTTIRPVPINEVDSKGNVVRRRMGYYYEPATKDFLGENGARISGERVRRTVIDDIQNTKWKAGQNNAAPKPSGTKASENTKGTKTTTSNKATIPGWNN